MFFIPSGFVFQDITIDSRQTRRGRGVNYHVITAFGPRLWTAICFLPGNFAVLLGNFKFQTIIWPWKSPIPEKNDNFFALVFKIPKRVFTSHCDISVDKVQISSVQTVNHSMRRYHCSNQHFIHFKYILSSLQLKLKV